MPMTVRRGAFALSLALTMSAAAAAECPSRALHALELVRLKDSRVAVPVTFGNTPGALILDSAGVAQPPIDPNRRSVPVTGSNVAEFTAPRPSYAGVAGTLTRQTIAALGLRPVETGVRYSGAGGNRRETKVVVREFALRGLAPSTAEFLVAAPEGPAADYAGAFALNNSERFPFNVAVDFAAANMRLYPRGCAAPPTEWTGPGIAKLDFKVDGNGFLVLPVTLDGERLEAVVDTGSVASTLDMGAAANTFHLSEKDPSVRRVTQLSDGRTLYLRAFRSLSFGAVEVGDPQLMLLDGLRGRSKGSPTGTRVVRDPLGALPPVLIGMSILGHLRLLFDFGERTIYIARAAAPATKPE